MKILKLLYYEAIIKSKLNNSKILEQKKNKEVIGSNFEIDQQFCVEVTVFSMWSNDRLPNALGGLIDLATVTAILVIVELV